MCRRLFRLFQPDESAAVLYISVASIQKLSINILTFPKILYKFQDIFSSEILKNSDTEDISASHTVTFFGGYLTISNNLTAICSVFSISLLIPQKYW